MKLTVILSVYNGGALLKKSLESLLIQDIDDIEIFIVDDCSSDNSRIYLQTIKDNRVSIFYNDVNKGLFHNLNYLIQKSNADLITLWSQDDIMYSGALQKNILIHIKYPQIGFSYASRDIIDEGGLIIYKFDNSDNTPEFIDFNLYHRICSFTGSISGNIANVTFKRKILTDLGLFDTTLHYSADFDMQVKVGMKYPVGRICESTYALRNHSEQLSKKKGYEIFQLKDDIKVFATLHNATTNIDLKMFLQSCNRWRRSIYYFAVWKKVCLRGNVREIIEYGKYLNKFSFLPFIIFRIILIRINLGKNPKISI